jgi:putative hemolysin
MMEIGLMIGALVVLTLFSAFSSASETAFFSLPIGRVRQWRTSSDHSRRLVSHLLAHARYLLVLIFMLNTLLNVLIQNVASDMADLFGGGYVQKVGIPLCLILIFGEFLPKYLGMLASETLAVHAAPFFSFLERTTSPLQRIITFTAETLSRIFFFFLKPDPPLAPKELEGIIETCETKGVLSPEEASLIRYSLEFESKEARELMTPRSEMPAIKRSLLTKEAIVSSLRSSPRSSILLIDETMDHPIGALSAHEALLFQTGDVNATLSAATRELFFVPESMSARKLLQEFSERSAAMACVIDEHGTITGFIESDDIAKTLLGFPQKKSGLIPMSSRMKQKSIIVPGTTPLGTVNALFRTSLASSYHSATIGGWLIEMLDGIPSIGASFVKQDLVFRVLSADEKMIKQLFIQKKNGKSAEALSPLPPEEGCQ